jgi:hypothetical protein
MQASLVERNSGVHEAQDAKECRHTLLLEGVLDERFSWCLSRRVRKRETPELFMVLVGTHAGLGEGGGREVRMAA